MWESMGRFIYSLIVAFIVYVGAETIISKIKTKRGRNND